MNDQATPQVIDQDDRFAVIVDDTRAGYTIYVDHEAADGTVERIFPHTTVQEEYAGQGLASVLVRGALEATIAAGARIVPVCPYVKGWIEKHPDFASHVVAPTPTHLQLLR
ncbi:GNAT family N-acetyltransferase [Citricoccus sp. NR2]|uniref:GNAT family N-acetyltransferase n=1 Tax=Citricoccus sp. NR2 TaxID=3004095 RepID=UPI0022DCED2F|nr:GNAT family N-acetyltransferase [Citricoccus sp. NR2]WBL19192.1 GNAT family N-acetyltransferase [Citricoccus sp. NR2]